MDTTNPHAMVVRADARAMGAVTALSKHNRTLGARTRTVALSPVYSYNPSHGIDRDHATEFTPSRTSVATASRKHRTVTAQVKRAAIDAALMAGMGTIHNEN